MTMALQPRQKARLSDNLTLTSRRLTQTFKKYRLILEFPEEMLAHTPQLTSYLSARAPEKLLEVEDTQILNGNGTAPNLSGIITDTLRFCCVVLQTQLKAQMNLTF